MIDKAREIIPGGVQHNLAFNYPFPLVFTKAEGAYLYDADGNKYFDFLQAGGPTVLGSNMPEVREEVIDLLNDCGPSTGLFHEYEYKLGKKISDSMESVEMFRMLGSGTEACMAAIRVARLATGKKNVIKVGGAQGYFGISPDLTVFGKVVAGGHPGAGGLGGKKEYMKFLSAGIAGGPKQKKALIGGTMAATPLSCVAGYHALSEIERTGAAEHAAAMGDRLTKGLQELIKKHDLPFVAWNQGSICHLETVGTLHYSINWKKPWQIPEVLKQTSLRQAEMEHMGAAYMAEGLVTLAGSRLYTSAAYTPEMIDEALEAFDRVFEKVGVVEVED